MSDFLTTMAEASRVRVRAAKQRVREAALWGRARSRPDPPVLRLDASSFDVVAEFKARGPRGQSFASATPRAALEQAAAYERGGACAVSVLTEPTAFRGSLDDLAAVAQGATLPILRKDFLVDPYQVIEARALGAAGVLFVARLLDDGLLTEMVDTAAALGLFSVVEAFDEEDFDRAAAAVLGARGTAFLGVNARDLRTLAVEPKRHAAWAEKIPDRCRAVAESGLGDAADVARVAALGYRAALVGSALMRAPDPSALLTAMISSGRTAAAGREVTR